MLDDALPAVANKKGNEPFPISWQWIALVAFLYIGWLNFVYFLPSSQEDRSAEISDFLAGWFDSFIAAILIPLVIAYVAKGRKHYRNGFNRWFFWGMVLMLLIQKTAISANYERQRSVQSQTSRGIK